MNKKTIISIILIIVFFGVIYLLASNKESSTDTIIETNQSPVVSDENPQPGNTGDTAPVEPAAAAARKDLATKLSVDEKSIVIMSVTDTTWNDGCLGLGGAAESCMQALVPGFRVEMIANGKTYFYRTDKIGTAIRAEVQ